MSFLTDFVRLAALIISLSFTFSIFQRNLRDKSPWLKYLFSGILFSLIAVISMLTPIEMAPGIIIDARIITIVYAAVFGGIPSAFIVVFSVSVTRYILGGAGLSAGMLTIFLGFALALGVHKLYTGTAVFSQRHYSFLFAITGFLSAFIFFIAMLFLPSDLISENLVRSTSVPLIIIFTLVGWFAGILLKREEERFLLEEKLKEGIERKRKVLSIASEGYFDWDLETGKLFLDSNYYRMAGYNPGDFTGNGNEWRSRIHSDDLLSVEQALEAFTEGITDEFICIYRFRKKDGSWMWVHGKAVAMKRDSQGRVLKMLGTHSDITDYKESQQELKRFQSAIEHAAEAIIITDTEGIIIYSNPAFSRMTGYTRNEITGQKTDLLKSGEQSKDFYRNIWETISRGESWSGQLRNRRKDGTLYTENSVISPVLAEDNRTITNYVSIKKDITGDLDLQEQIQQSRKMQAVGQLAGGVAHDFNNMLTGIITATMMLKRTIPPDGQSDKYLSIIDEAVQRSAELTKNLLSFSRKQPKLLNIISLHDSLLKTVKFLSSTLDKKIDLKVNLYEGDSAIIGDGARIENAVLNLCINASHAIEGTGEIVLKTEVVYFDQNRCDKDPFDLQPGKYIHLTVSDNGKGIPPEYLNKIFEPFFTTKVKNKGTGLGLTAVYTMVQQHNGSISVESTPGQGTRFHLYFYLVDHKEERKHILSDQRTEKREGTILLVDDEALIRNPLKDMLQDGGYNVYSAENGQEAIEIFSDHCKNIDLVILDVIMPKMDGLDCLKGLRNIKPEIPVIVETGYASDEKLYEMKDLGIQGIIRKPARENEIFQAIENVSNATKDADRQ